MTEDRHELAKIRIGHLIWGQRHPTNREEERGEKKCLRRTASPTQGALLEAEVGQMLAFTSPYSLGFFMYLGLACAFT